MNKAEAELAYALSEYLTLQYPDVVFRWDAGGIRLTIGQAMVFKNKFLHKRGYPDLFIAEPIGKWAGMFLEIKAAPIFKRDKTLRKNPHLQEQADMICKLFGKGYYATFGVGFDDCKKKIDTYLQTKTGKVKGQETS